MHQKHGTYASDMRRRQLAAQAVKDTRTTMYNHFPGHRIRFHMDMRLLQDKQAHAMDMLLYWHHRKAGLKRDFLSMIRMLAHTSKVIRSNRTFLHRLTTVAKPDHFLCLNQESKSDIEWWFQFIKCWNHISMLLLLLQPSLTVTSGSWGCGALSDFSGFIYPGLVCLLTHTSPSKN